jgi:hypothetical protein
MHGNPNQVLCTKQGLKKTQQHLANVIFMEKLSWGRVSIRLDKTYSLCLSLQLI